MNIQKSGYHGILLPDYDIGFDLSGPETDHIFISHAHADHMPRNRSASVYATPPTTALMRLRGFKGKVHELEFNSTIRCGEANVTLYPAGHILGSAMTFVETPQGNVLYTGDYRTPPSPASEGFELPDPDYIDYFITEATFSLPIYRWEDHAVSAASIRTFANEALENNYTPVFLGYNLGKAQEIMHMLAPLGHPVQIHGAGYKLCSVYDQFGIDLGNYETYSRPDCEGNILVCPTSALSNGFASNVSKKRIAYCSGWASLESRRSQLTVDKLIPLSDHLDFFELIDLCKTINPKKVYITHTPNADVVRHYLNEEDISSAFLDLETEEEAQTL